MRSPFRLSLLCITSVIAVVVVSTGCGGDDAPADAAAPSSPEDHKITVAGDSISVGLGSQLREVVGDRATVKVIGEVGTGLARPDNFDWPTRLRQLADEFPPSVLVFSLGSNDAQDLTDTSGEVVASRSDDAEWDAEYSRRLAESFDAFEDTGTTVVWVGHVRTKEARVGETNRHIHRLAEQVASTRPWVEVADLGQLLGTGEKTATTCLVPDGLHLTVDCLTKADRALLPQLVP